jgi:Fe-S cluster biogenesis protein NfuA
VTAARETDIAGPMRRIEALVRSLEACGDAAAREGARDLVRTVLDLHAAGLAKLLELARQSGEPGGGVAERFARDPLVSSLLLLHGLHPVPVERRVADAIDDLRPRLRSSGGDVELLAFTEEMIRVRLHGDRSSGPALRLAVEAALTEVAADVPILEIEEDWDRDSGRRVSLPLIGARGAE